MGAWAIPTTNTAQELPLAEKEKKKIEAEGKTGRTFHTMRTATESNAALLAVLAHLAFLELLSLYQY